MADTISTVLREVASHFGVTVRDIRSARRTRAILPARHAAAYLMHTLQGATAAEIGSRLGGRDYTTITMYCRAAARRAEVDEVFGRDLAELELQIRGQLHWS